MRVPTGPSRPYTLKSLLELRKLDNYRNLPVVAQRIRPDIPPYITGLPARRAAAALTPPSPARPRGFRDAWIVGQVIARTAGVRHGPALRSATGPWYWTANSAQTHEDRGSAPVSSRNRMINLTYLGPTALT